MPDNIRYYLQRVRTEIKQAKLAVNREVTIAHFNLADAYLERIHQLFQEIGDIDARE
jgi:hypothetical protein